MTATEHLNEIHEFYGRPAATLTLAQIQFASVLLELRRTSGNVAEAAANLGLGRACVYGLLNNFCRLTRGISSTAPKAVAALLFTTVAAWAQVPPLPMAAAALPAPVKYLTWDTVPEATGYLVRCGTNRFGWTNSFSVPTNRVPYTAGVFYIVSTLGAGGESAPAYWPSNRIAELWLVGYGTDLTQATNIARLTTYTNVPPERMRFWGVQERTSHYE